MAEVSRVEFETALEDLKEALKGGVHTFAQQRGLGFDAERLRQTGQDLDAALRDVLMFGCDLWPSEDEKPRGAEVIPFPKKSSVGRVSRAGRAVVAGINVMGAAAGLTLLAALCSEGVNLPGLPYVAEQIYLKNLPKTTERILEIDGRYVRVNIARKAGQHPRVLHVERFEPVQQAELVELGLVPKNEPLLHQAGL